MLFRICNNTQNIRLRACRPKLFNSLDAIPEQTAGMFVKITDAKPVLENISVSLVVRQTALGAMYSCCTAYLFGLLTVIRLVSGSGSRNG